MKKIVHSYSKFKTALKSKRKLINFKWKLLTSPSKRIVIGASGIHDFGWIPAEENFLNLLKQDDWEHFFRPNSIDAMLAEHVWEHLTLTEGLLAAKVCFRYLKHGGHIRIAVPDGLHPNSEYIEWVKVKGIGVGADDHKVLYTYKTLKQIFEDAGFQVVLHEYFDESHKFYYQEWSTQDGTIQRSKRFDIRNENGTLSYTSIILDAIKPTAHIVTQ